MKKKRQKRSSVSYVDIPEEIVFDILVRLPVKSLIRFRCVSKRWFSLIGSPSFISAHLTRNVTECVNTYEIALLRAPRGRTPRGRTPRLDYRLFSTETYVSLELRHPDWTEEGFKIYGSSKGLVCISDEILGPRSPICIWNPCIRKYRTLPQSRFKKYYKNYDISLSFGFNPELNDYQVVALGWFARHYVMLQVYSLSANSWKKIEVIPPWLKFNPDWCEGYAFLNGVAYWLFVKAKKYRCVSFDTGSEKFEELVVPEAISERNSRAPIDLEVYNDSIYLLQSSTSVSQLGMNLWVLQEQSFKMLQPEDDTNLTALWEFVESLVLLNG